MYLVTIANSIDASPTFNGSAEVSPIPNSRISARSIQEIENRFISKKRFSKNHLENLDFLLSLS